MPHDARLSLGWPLWVALGLTPLGPLMAIMTGWAIWQPHWPALSSLIMGVVAAPVIEEIVFRGGLQSLLARNRTLRLAHVGPIGAANALASVGFAAGHVVMRDSMAVALVFLPSLVLGWLYDRCGRLGPVIGVHASYNLAWLTLLGPG
ncbi:MAG: hypothetical protein CMP08_05450 [Xanthomonadales bacterium]|nr:hypothetical protein [Xanthomonadales bacterium]